MTTTLSSLIDSTTRAFDLTNLRNGASGLLGATKLDEGKYAQIRLKISVGSNVVVGGLSLPLEVSSGVQKRSQAQPQF